MEAVRRVERKFRWFLLIAITVSGTMGLPYWLPLMLPAHAAAPTLVINSVAQKTDGSGSVDVSVTVNDADGDDTVKVKASYKSGADCSNPLELTPATLDTTDENTTATYGDPKIDNTAIYRVGSAAGWILTSSGANTVQFDWLSATDIPAADGTYCLGILANDGAGDSVLQTISFTLDNVDPATPGDLSNGGITTTSITATFGAQSSDTNFDKYRMFYLPKIGGVGPPLTPLTGTEHSDANLLSVNYGGASGTTLSTLSVNTLHEIGIWAYDTYGNNTNNALNLSVYTAANVPSAPTLAAVSTTSLSVAITPGDGNPDITEYAIQETGSGNYVKSDGTLGAGEFWANATTWGTMLVTGLSVNFNYTFKVKARNGDSVETVFGSTASKYTWALQVSATGALEFTNKTTYRINLLWTNEGQTGLKIAQDTDCNGSWDTTVYDNEDVIPASPYTVSGLSANTCYGFRFYSYSGNAGVPGDGDLNTVGMPEQTKTSAPGQPLNLTHTANTASTISLDWADVADALSYSIFNADDDSLYKNVIGISETILDVPTANTQYNIYVRAINFNGIGIASSPVSAYSSSDVPVSLGHTSQTTSSMRWTWASGGSEAGFWARTTNPVAAVADWITDLFWDQTELTANNLVAFYVKAKNGDGDATNESSISKYTSQNAPSGITFGTVATDSITVTADGTFPNLTSGSSGIQFIVDGAAVTWRQDATWENSGLSPNTQYEYSAKARNGDTDETATCASSSKYTLANVPSAPTVQSPAATTLTVIINQNSNPAATTYAIQDVGGSKYVQADGSLGDSAVWQTYAVWSGASGVVVTGLSVNTSYQFKVKAKNGDGVETALSSASTAIYTLANVPVDLVATSQSTTSITLAWGINSNPSGTGYYVTNSTAGTNSGWITEATYTFSNLSVGTSYTFNVKARNGDGTETAATADYTKSTNNNAPIPPQSNPSSGPADAEVPDAEVPDAEVPDAEVPDAEVPDAEVPDAEVPDAEVPDAEVPEAEQPKVPEKPSEPEIPEIPVPKVPQPKPSEFEPVVPQESAPVVPTGEEAQPPVEVPASGVPETIPAQGKTFEDIIFSATTQIKEFIAPAVEASIKISKALAARPDSNIKQQMLNLKHMTLDNPQVQRINDVAQVPILVTTGAATAATLAGSIGAVANYLQYLITQPLVLWYRRRKKEWGVVYDSITKRPVDLAVIRVFDAKTNRLLETRVTDKNGRYHFILEPGEYYVVVQKQEYAFPSGLLNEAVSDERYGELYYGKPIKLDQKGALTMNVPLDPDKKMVSNRHVLLSHFTRRAQYALLLLGPIFSAISLAINPTPWIGAILVAHLICLGLFLRVMMPQVLKDWGIVKAQGTGAPLKRAVARVFDSRFNKLLDSQVTDSSGRYSFLAGSNIYYVTAEKDGFVPQRSDFIDLRRSKDGGFINLDLFLKRQRGETIENPVAEVLQSRKLEKEAQVMNKQETVAGIKVGELHEDIRDLDYIK